MPTVGDILFCYSVGAALSFMVNAMALEEMSYRVVGRTIYWPAFLLKFFVVALCSAVTDLFGDFL